MGFIKAPPVKAEVEEFSEEVNELPELARLDSELSFVVDLAEGVSVPWSCRMKDNNLIVDVPLNLPQYGSRDSFVALLEYAEHGLKVEHIVVSLSKTRKDCADLIRLFMFFGFAPVAPGSTKLLVPESDDELIYLVYEAN